MMKLVIEGKNTVDLIKSTLKGWKACGAPKERSELS
jgi:hypothetical protein